MRKSASHDHIRQLYVALDGTPTCLYRTPLSYAVDLWELAASAQAVLQGTAGEVQALCHLPVGF
jgi:hypothetical protein